MFLPGRASFVSFNQILSDPLGLIKIVDEERSRVIYKKIQENLQTGFNK